MKYRIGLVVLLFILLPRVAFADCCSLGCCDCSCVAKLPELSGKAQSISDDFNAVLKKHNVNGVITDFVINDNECRNENVCSNGVSPSCEWQCWNCDSGRCCGLSCSVEVEKDN